MSNHEFTRNIAETLRMVEKRDLRNGWENIGKHLKWLGSRINHCEGLIERIPLFVTIRKV